MSPGGKRGLLVCRAGYYTSPLCPLSSPLTQGPVRPPSCATPRLAGSRIPPFLTGLGHHLAGGT